jgi:membrane-associated phospholipid phosphatase
MPTSTSFPSGHSASAFAFATAVGKEILAISGPLRGLAGAVAYSRVHTGVHYPTDVIIGASIGDVTLALLRFAKRRHTAHA